MLLKSSLKQMGRAKGRMFSFLLLMILAVTFLSLGVNLWQACNKNLKEYEKVFTTIGIVNQKENAVKVTESWDASIREYAYQDEPVYDSILPVSLLDFEGANYITPPEQRPHYVAYSSGIKVWPAEEEESFIRDWASIIEFTPYKDAIPTKPVKVRITKVLGGSRREGEDIWLCDQFNDNPGLLEAGKTYITSIQTTICPFSDEKYQYLPYAVPYNFTISNQMNKNGEKIKGEVPYVEEWVEVTNGFYETKVGKAWKASAIISDRFIRHSFPVIPTNKTELLMDFHQGNTSISQGRNITDEEYSNGEKVCIIPQRFAGRNNLKVGDKINLQLYFADYKRPASLTYYPLGSLQLHFTLLNAKGEAYPIFDDSDYEIVGIYSGTNQNNNPTGYEIGFNGVVIPSKSVKNSDENNIVDYGPMKGYTTSFQIPNGTTKEYMKKFQALGIDNLEISFYDGGYERLASGMKNLKMVALILVTVSSATTLAILFFFIFLFITKQKKRTAIERSLGMSKKECILSMLYGILGITSIGAAVGSFAGFKITGLVMRDSTGEEELYSTAFSNWVNNSDKVAGLSTSGALTNPLIPILLCFVVILVSLVIALVFINNNLKVEPLGLLSKSEE